MKKVEEFLREYADVLRGEMDWKTVAPCHPQTRMAAGIVQVLDRDGEVMAVFMTRNMPSSMPVSQRDIQCAKLLCDIINYLAGADNGET